MQTANQTAETDQLQLPLYVGIALIVGSTAFLMRDSTSTSFFVHVMMALIAPALFYAVGGLAIRYLRAMLVPRGIVAAGAWLLTAGLIHLSTKTHLIESGEILWRLGIIAAAIVVTFTGHRVRFAALYPLVMILQVSGAWSLMGLLNQPPHWVAPLLLPVSAFWWFGVPRFSSNTRWLNAYQIGALVLVIAAIGLSLFLRANAIVTPFSTSLTLILGGALLLAMMGRDQLLAAHSGVWLIGGGWILFYFDWLRDTGAFGLWLALMATAALLIERVWSTQHKNKRKSESTLVEAVTGWALADLALGLTVLILLWTARNIDAAPPLVMTITLMVTSGLWIAAGLVYRLPALLYAALIVLPLPYALLLTYLMPSLWTLPLMGIEWQLLALGFIVLGHTLTKRRPAIRLPFFAAGYLYLLFGLTLTLNSTVWLPLSLGIVVIAAFATSMLVFMGHHPVWVDLIDRLMPPEISPFLNGNFRNLFLLIGGWMGALWVLLMLSYTGMPGTQQGLTLVALSAGWFVLGRMLMTMPRVSGWMIYSASWLLWLIGLLMVFHTVPEAIMASVIGLILCGEAIARTRAAYWMPIAVLQIGFVGLKLAWVLELNPQALFMILMIILGYAGWIIEARSKRWAHIGVMTAYTTVFVSGWLALTWRTDGARITFLILAGAFVVRYWRSILRIIYEKFIVPLVTVLIMTAAFAGLVGVGIVIAHMVQWVIGINPWLLPLGLGVILIAYAMIRELLNAQVPKSRDEIIEPQKESVTDGAEGTI